MSHDGDLVVEVRDLRMRYGPNEVLRGVDLQLHQGEVVTVLGPNGAGKTTAIEILEGFRMRSAGEVRVLGQDPAHGTEAWRARIGIVLQSWRDHRKWRARELLAHIGSYYPPYSTAQTRRPWDTDELIAAVGLAEHANKKLMRLSGGQRRRLDVAIGLVGRPELLFLDEPTAGLDPVGRREFHDLVAAIVKQGDTTILLTTHDLSEADKLADRIVILNHGVIVAQGTSKELSAQIAGEDEVRWTRDGQQFRQSAAESTKFVYELFKQYGEAIEDLEVRRASLEDTYLSLVRRAEGGQASQPAAAAANQARRARAGVAR